MIWGIISLLFAFFLGPLAKTTIPRLGLAGLYVIAAFLFLTTLLELDSPLYYHFVPQTLALFDLSFTADFLSLSFCVIISVIGAIVMAYSAHYIDEEDGPRFSTLINFFTLSMLGLVLSNNLLGLFIFWEFTSICSFFLISFDERNPDGRKAAWQSLIVTAMGGLCLLCGLLILGGIGGSYDLLQMRVPEDHPWMGPAIILIFLGVLTKSAQFPFYFWLPNAMTAPTPASAYLHAATMVKAGIFLLFRLSPYLATHDYWGNILIPAGILTAGISSVLLLMEKDLKKILAYTTLGSLGLMVYMIGKNTEVGYYLALLWLITHALYKAPLFLLAGNIEHYAGTRDVTKLSELYPRMKGSLLVAILAAFSLLGIPPVLSFHTKESFFILLGSSPLEFWGLILLFATWGSVALTLIALFIRGDRDGRSEGRFFDDQDDPALMWLPTTAALIISFMIGIRYTPFTQFLRVNLGQVLTPNFSEIAFIKGNPQLGYYASAAIIFFAIFFALISNQLRQHVFVFSNRFKFLHKVNFVVIWDFLFKGLFRVAAFIFNRFQNNRLELYSLMYFVFLIFLIFQLFVFTPMSGAEFQLPLLSLKFTHVTPFEVALIAAMIIASTLAIKAESNLSALAVLGVIGFGTSYLYLVNAAPDLALTQFLVESLMLILLVLTFKYLPKIRYRVESKFIRSFYTFVSIVVGLTAGLLTFLAASSLRPQTLTRYFGEKSLTLAHGRNVVNVTIVDFRALDTLGEITVMILAAVGVLSLLRRKANTSGSIASK